VKVRFKWRRHWYGASKPGRCGWILRCRGRTIGGVVRYRWGGKCIGYLCTGSGDRDLIKASTPGPAKHRVETVARSILGQEKKR
jgi:hypothetical protein